MEWVNKNWDKALLALIAVVVILVSVLFVKRSLGYADEFKTDAVPQSNEFPKMDVERIEGAVKLVKEDVMWIPPMKGEPKKQKELPLFVSIPIVEKGGRLYDMSDPDEDSLRPPVSNPWLLEHELDFLNAKVLEQDSDSDGFSNLEEWDAKTSPRDPGSHPPFSDKLYFVERKQTSYRIEFQATPGENKFQIKRHPTSAYRAPMTFIKALGETSDDGVIRFDSYQQKEGKNNLGITVDMSELTVTYLPTKQQFTLVRRVPMVIPTYYAILEFELDKKGAMAPIKQGDFFTLSIDPDTKYKLVDIQEEEAQISYETEPGREQTVKISKNN